MSGLGGSSRQVYKKATIFFFITTVAFIGATIGLVKNPMTNTMEVPTYIPVPTPVTPPSRVRAQVVFHTDPAFPNDNVSGYLNFEQFSGQMVNITGMVYGLNDTAHGIHIHASGVIYPTCSSALGHYNPANMTHGAPWDTVRHFGDLGNLNSTSGIASFSLVDRLVQLSGVNSVIGRAVVIHQYIDDLGLGGVPASKTTGNSGSRVACGVIGLVDILN